jgi:CheY-like chemotaxis protein
VRNFAPDVVLLDIAMPDRGGYDIAEELWGRYGDRGAILVAVSARTIDREHHFNHVVSKPYDPSDLITLLASYNGRIR